MIPHLVTLSNEFINLSLKYNNIRLAKTRISNITKNHDLSGVGNRLDDNNNHIENNCYISRVTFSGGIVGVWIVSKL